MVRLVLSVMGLGFSSAHYLFMQEGAPGEVIVTFGEGGEPGLSAFCSADDVFVTSTVNSTHSENVTLSKKRVGFLNAELVGSFSAEPPFRLQLTNTYGIFSGTLLKYTSSVGEVTTQNDWIKMQDWGVQSGLEITIRDPYNGQAPEFGFGGFPGDQCESGQKFQDGDACVLAIVRFDGELLPKDMNITTFAGDGTEIATTFQPAQGYGVTILKVPLDSSAAYTEVFAKVNYRQEAPGQYGGEAYDIVDHWATAYARIVRASDDGQVMV